MTMQHGQHNNRTSGDEVENAVFEYGQVHPPYVGEANGIQSGIGRESVKPCADFGKKSLFKTGLLAPIPLGAVGEISFNERVKGERQHFCGRG